MGSCSSSPRSHLSWPCPRSLLAVCQVEQRFLTISVAGFAGAAASLATMLLLWDQLGLRAFAVGSLTGPLLTLAVLVGDLLRASLFPLLVLRPGGRLGPFARHAAPLTAGAAILQLNIVADRAVASLLGPGAVSVLRYADVLVRVPIGAIGPAWGAAVSPALVRSTLSRVAASLALDTQRALRYVAAVFVPVAMLTAAVAPLVVKLAYGRGAFTADALNATAWAVVAFAPLLLLLMTCRSLVGAHNARRRGEVLLAGATLNVALNFALDVVLGIFLGVAGVALRRRISSALVLAFLAWRLALTEAGFTVSPIIRTMGLAALASAPVTIAAALLCWSGVIPSEVLVGIVVLVGIGVVGPIGYLLAAIWLGMEELALWRTLRRPGSFTGARLAGSNEAPPCRLRPAESQPWRSRAPNAGTGRTPPPRPLHGRVPRPVRFRRLRRASPRRRPAHPHRGGSARSERAVAEATVAPGLQGAPVRDRGASRRLRHRQRVALPQLMFWPR